MERKLPLVTTRQLLEAGVHFGHQTHRWNPKMRPYIYGRRDGLYIIDIEKTVDGLEGAYAFLEDLASQGGIVLMVGTKSQAKDVIAEEATRLGMPYVNQRWLGGLLTNFETIRRRIARLKELEATVASGQLATLPKKESLSVERELEKLSSNLGGVRELTRLPDALYVIDINRERIAVSEARRLGIPIVGIVDTNCDPELVDYVVPANDDAIRSDSLITRILADAIEQGKKRYEQSLQSITASGAGDHHSEVGKDREDRSGGQSLTRSGKASGKSVKEKEPTSEKQDEGNKEALTGVLPEADSVPSDKGERLGSTEDDSAPSSEVETVTANKDGSAPSDKE